jgi:hypothetical protein
MTDLKMCEKGRATIHSKVIGNDGWSIKSQELDIDYWIPIEPQPSCSRCEHYDCEMQFCPKNDMQFDDGSEEHFFCCYWKAKK